MHAEGQRFESVILHEDEKVHTHIDMIETTSNTYNYSYGNVWAAR